MATHRGYVAKCRRTRYDEGFGKIQKAEKDENKTRKFEEENSVHQSVNVEQRSAGSARLSNGRRGAARGGESSLLRTWKEEHPAQWG